MNSIILRYIDAEQGLESEFLDGVLRGTLAVSPCMCSCCAWTLLSGKDEEIVESKEDARTG